MSVVISETTETFTTNRESHSSSRDSNVATVNLAGPTRFMSLEGSIDFITTALPYCVNSPYEDEVPFSLPVGPVTVRYRYFVRRGELILWEGEVHTANLIVPANGPTNVDLKFLANLEVIEPIEGLVDFDVGVEVLEVLNRCGEAEVEDRHIVLNVKWLKSPSNVCLPCIAGNAKK